MRLSVSPFSSHTTLNLFPAVGYSGYWANSPEITSHHIPSLPRHFSISKIWRHLRWFSLWVLPGWYLMNWCAGDVADRAGDCTMVWISPAFFPLVPYFSSFLSIPPHSLLLSLYTIFFPSPAPPLTLTLSSLQEVLELAFSVLYESDEYLNFIAPDKHEVRQYSWTEHTHYLDQRGNVFKTK